MKVDRALEKLRGILGTMGVTSTAGALAALIASQAITAAPVGLAAAVSTAALAASAAPGSGTAFTLLKLMSMTKLKTAVAGLIVATALAPLVLLEYQSRARLRAEIAALRAELAQLEGLRAENERLSKLKVDADELERLRREHLELLRLRGRVGALRQELRQATAPSLPAAAAATVTPPASSAFVSSYVARVQANVGDAQTLLTGGWSVKPGRRVLVLLTPRIAPDGAAGQVMFEAMFVEAPDEVLAGRGLERFQAAGKETSQQGVLTAAEARALLKHLEGTPGVDILSAPRLSTADGRQAQIQMVELKTVPGSDEQVPFGPMLDVVPRLAPDGASVDVTLQAQLNLPVQE
jgi:type II secretory pathway pseudopilin PulG